MEKFFTTEQVANILQVHPFTILKFIKNGKLKGIKLGRVYRIKESDVSEFLEGAASHKSGHAAKTQSTENPEGHYLIDKKSDQKKVDEQDTGEHYYII